MKIMKAKLGDISFRANSSESDKSSAFFISDPICTSYPFVNLNHFIFKPEAIRKNVKSMAMKPLNFMHEQERIVGHVNSADFGMDSLGRTTGNASGVLYQRIFPDLVDKMINGQSYNMFKVSVEAQMNDMSWMLFDNYENIQESKQEKMLGEDPVLDGDAMFCLWLFGTLNGLKYNDKNVAVVIGGQSDSFEFVGLAVTDELNGGAADQNCRIIVLSSASNPIDIGAFVAAKAKEIDVNKFEVAKAIMRDEKDLLIHCGITDEIKQSLLEEFTKFKSVWIEHSQPQENDEEVEDEQGETDGEDLPTEEPKDNPGVVSAESVAETIAALVLMKVEEADKTSRKYMRVIESLNKKIAKSEDDIATANKNLQSLVTASGNYEKTINSMREELSALRKSELISLEIWDLAKEKDIVYMTSEEYVDLKKKLLSVPAVSTKKKESKSIFEEQAKRVTKR